MKPIVRVKFCFRKHDQKKWYSDFFCRILENRYQVIIDEENPDFIFHEAHLIDVIKYSGVRIAFAGENVRTDFNISDYGIGFDYLSFQDRYFRCPLYMFYRGSLDITINRPQYINSQSSSSLLDRKFCNFLVSNGSASEFRTHFFQELSKYKKVESGGSFLNNIGYSVEDKLKWQTGYKFSLCFENSSTSGYLTEKLVHAYASSTIPIYWGDPDAQGRLDNGTGGINPKAIVLVDPENPDEAIKKIQELDTNQESYLSVLKEPLFLDPDHTSKFQNDLETFLYSIFDQEKEDAFRRGFGQIRMRVENRNVARSSFIKSLMNFLKKRVKI